MTHALLMCQQCMELGFQVQRSNRMIRAIKLGFRVWEFRGSEAYGFLFRDLRISGVGLGG